MQVDLTDEELLSLPEANLPPGALTRAFAVRAEHRFQLQQQDEQRISHLLAVRKAEEQQADDQHKREEKLLERIQEREQELIQEEKALDQRAIKLADGRRAYVDGDTYRDAQGRELTGADKAQAEQGQLAQPHAATWQEKQHLDEEWRQNETAKQRVQDLQAGKAGNHEGKVLSAYEQEYSNNASHRQAAAEKLINPSTAYSTDTDAVSLAADFSAAATGPGQTDTLFPGSPAAITTTIKPPPAKPGVC